MKRRLIVADDWVQTASDLFVAARPRTIALAGGSTPAPLYARLATAAFDWAGIDVFFTDERCVGRSHPDSNHRMAFEALLRWVPARVHAMDGEHCDAPGYEKSLREHFGDGIPRLDLAVLGLGEDGHTASLFPGDPALEETRAWVVAVQRTDHRRLTMTLPVLSAARHAVFLAVGVNKAMALRRMLDGYDGPAARVAARVITIVADAAGASLVPEQERRLLEPTPSGGTGR